MPKALVRDWAQIRREYEGNKKPITAICKDHAVAGPTLYAHAAREGWTLRQTVRFAARPALIERLAKILERQIAHLEKNMTPGDEKEVALLGTMARTLEKLIDLDRKEQGQDVAPKRERELAEIKRKLAARIDHLRKS